MGVNNTNLVSKHPQTTVLASLTAIFESIAVHIKDSDYRQIVAPIAPFLALIITLTLKHLLKNYKCKKSIQLFKNWIISLEYEFKESSTTPGRKREIQKEIAKYKVELKEFEKDFIIIRYE
ncbi:hypothetical protein BH09BAC6_BH09BAC6_32960 [soil metagenome]|jgi:hypothetical protein